MAVLRAEVLEVLEVGEKFTRVRATYSRGHKMFSPEGFEFKFTNPTKEIEVGYEWQVGMVEGIQTMSDGSELIRPDGNAIIKEMLKNKEMKTLGAQSSIESSNTENQ